MVERGHFKELSKLLEMINRNEEAKRERQTFVFSATLTTSHDPPKRINLKQKVSAQYISNQTFLCRYLAVFARTSLTDGLATNKSTSIQS